MANTPKKKPAKKKSVTVWLFAANTEHGWQGTACATKKEAMSLRREIRATFDCRVTPIVSVEVPLV